MEFSETGYDIATDEWDNNIPDNWDDNIPDKWDDNILDTFKVFSSATKPQKGGLRLVCFSLFVFLLSSNSL